MLFNSYEFIFLFLPFTFFIYFYLNKKHLTEVAKGFLVLSSLFFYSWWNVAYLPLILGSMIFNYYFGLELNKDNPKISKKITLALGIALNLALLGYFKYSDFLISNINFAFHTQISHLNLLLPLAISFFTFQQIAYLVDSAMGGGTKQYDFLTYCLFVTFFPQLIAGPIVHHKEMIPQFANIRNRVINYKNIALGLFIFSIGLFKKVVIADTFAVWATNGFDKATTLNLFEAWATSLSYTFQLYFDFSGYCDMAIGAALLFNIKLPINFNSPYKALNIQDFWRRWHITLSRFLRDYIYIPLGGNRKGRLRTYTNLMATFIIGGIWHGAGWTFVFWGFLHGVALVIHRIWSELGFKVNKILAWFITFNFVNIAWVFFRAKEWDDAIKVLKGMFFGNIGSADNIIAVYDDKIEALFALFLFVLSFFIILSKNSSQFRPNMVHIFFASFLFAISVANFNKISYFLYFNF
ncbi:MBOAT family O-acyltransferase [Campylobacter concisus]